MIEVNFQLLDPLKLPLLKPLYKSYYPSARPKRSEQIVVGYHQQTLICVVRFRPIEQYHLLTGMLVIPSFRGQGIASQLLTFCQTERLTEQTFCFAYEHLESLYQSAGFQVIDTEHLPSALKHLFSRYTSSGKKLLPMQYKATVLT